MPGNNGQNHGQQVSAFAAEQRENREVGGPRGIGPAVSEFARTRGETEPPVDFEDGVITVVKDEEGGVTQTFATFAEALAYADDGDTLQVGAGVYEEAFDIDERLSIIGEEGAIVDGSGVAATTGQQGTIELFDGFSGGEISGLTVVAVEGGQALLNPYGEALEDVVLEGNVFDAGENTAGSLVYLNPNADGVRIEGNRFEGLNLVDSPLLGIEGDNVEVIGNTFNSAAGGYAEVEVFDGANGTSDDVTFTNNYSLPAEEISWA
ncbi:MAG TPA: hypothetical protein VD768_06205 [Sphingomicrobium sp.]|nr:hypothetical protein [Sphingomicrobium sp.]